MAISKNSSYALIASTLLLGVIVLVQIRQGAALRQENDQLKAAAEHRSSRVHLGIRNAAAVRSERVRDRRTATKVHSVQELLAIQNPSTRLDALSSYISTLSATEIPEALAELRRVVPHWDQEGKLFSHMLLSHWAKLDPEAALDSLQEVDTNRYGEAPLSVIAAIAAQAPQRAIAWLNDPENPFAGSKWMNQFIAGTISKEWVRQDPEAALTWARSVPTDQRLGALTGVLGSIAMTDPLRAATLAMEIEPGKSREHVVADIAQAWAAKDPRAALAWVEGLENDDRPKALNNTLAIWAQSEPQAAAEYVAKNLDEEKPHKLVKSVAEAWIGKAPDEAAKWLASLPLNEKGAKVMNDAMWHWTHKNPEAAATWLADQPAGQVRDQGITGLAKASFEFDKPAALSWSQQIGDEKLRNVATAMGLKAWMKESPQAAATWAQENGVSLPNDEN
ncbi:hypothetical protein JIN77_03510 [Verrucomicrobiaceae bacterium R5-34]|nr:hypothetical protein [Verrucomicrobiaceae bacterium R5-34]